MSEYRLTEDTPADAPLPVCDVLVVDATYALPIFRWPGLAAVADELRVWVQQNADAGRTALLAIAPEKVARLLGALAGMPHPIFGMGAQPLPEKRAAKAVAGALVLAPPSELETPTLPKLGPHETALASGRMRVRGNRRRLAIDRGFVLSSKPDWPTIARAVAQTHAREVHAFGTNAESLVRWLRDSGRGAKVIEELR